MSEGTLTKENLEKGRRYFAQAFRFVDGVATDRQLPEAKGVEVAFIGRSNVGKSSLLNALTGQKLLARVSNTPGRTRQLNFFTSDDHLFFVDMPGYGYAKGAKQEIAAWQGLSAQYLKTRTSLMRLFLLIDSRHGIKANDDEFMQQLDYYAIPYQLVLTKWDKLKNQVNREDMRQDVLSQLTTHTAAHPNLHITSSEKGVGIPELRTEIVNFLSQT